VDVCLLSAFADKNSTPTLLKVPGFYLEARYATGRSLVAAKLATKSEDEPSRRVLEPQRAGTKRKSTSVPVPRAAKSRNQAKINLRPRPCPRPSRPSSHASPVPVPVPRPKLDEKIARRIQQLLLQTNTMSKTGRRVLSYTLGINGWVEGDDRVYDGIRRVEASVKSTRLPRWRCSCNGSGTRPCRWGGRAPRRGRAPRPRW
jgi:hypothetical protein